MARRFFTLMKKQNCCWTQCRPTEQKKITFAVVFCNPSLTLLVYFDFSQEGCRTSHVIKM